MSESQFADSFNDVMAHLRRAVHCVDYGTNANPKFSWVSHLANHVLGSQILDVSSKLDVHPSAVYDAVSTLVASDEGEELISSHIVKNKLANPENIEASKAAYDCWENDLDQTVKSWVHSSNNRANAPTMKRTVETAINDILLTTPMPPLARYRLIQEIRATGEDHGSVILIDCSQINYSIMLCINELPSFITRDKFFRFKHYLWMLGGSKIPKIVVI